MFPGDSSTSVWGTADKVPADGPRQEHRTRTKGTGTNGRTEQRTKGAARRRIQESTPHRYAHDRENLIC